MASSIGTRIKELRKKINISQEDLANELYVSRQTISKWESDIVSPDIKNIEMISKYFDVSADYLINGKENGKIAKQNKNPDLHRVGNIPAPGYNIAAH